MINESVMAKCLLITKVSPDINLRVFEQPLFQTGPYQQDQKRSKFCDLKKRQVDASAGKFSQLICKVGTNENRIRP